MPRKLYRVCNVSGDKLNVVIRNDYTPLYEYLIHSHGKKWAGVYEYAVEHIDKPIEILRIVKNITSDGKVFGYPELDMPGSMVRLNGVLIAKYAMIHRNEYWSTMYVDKTGNLMLIDKSYEVKNPYPNNPHSIKFNGKNV